MMDVDSLCRKHTLAELKEIEKKVRTDVERKKEDLRELVSVRYRDLIDAADKIQGMHGSITNVVDQLNHFHSVQVSRMNAEKCVIDSHGIEENLQVSLDEALDSALLYAPETIMKCLDNCDTLTAALVFAFVRNFVWQRNIEKPKVTEDARWTFLRAYGDFISADVFKLFQKVSFEPQESSALVISLVVLNSSTKTFDILPQFFSVRTALITSFLASSSNHPVKEIVRFTMLSILETFRSVHEVFTSGRLVRFLNDFSRQAQPKIYRELFPNISNTSLSHLKDYFDGVVTAAAESGALPVAGTIERVMLDWFDQTVTSSTQNLSQTLQFLPTLQAVVDVHNAVLEVLEEEDNSSPSIGSIMGNFSNSLDTLNSLFENSIRLRLSSVLRDRLEKVLADTTDHLLHSLSSQNKEPEISNRNKIELFVPSLAGLEISAALRPTARKKFPGSVKRQGKASHQDDLSSSDPSSYRLSSLLSFLTEVESSSTNLHHHSSRIWIDSATVEAITEFILLLVKAVQRLSEESSLGDRASRLSYLYAFLRNITNQSIPQLDGSSIRGPLAEVLRNELNSCSDLIFEQWLTLILDNFRDDFLRKMNENLNVLQWSLNVMLFQTFTLEEMDETGKAVQYSVKVPTKASNCLHSAFQSLHESLIGFSVNQNILRSTVPSRCFSLIAFAYEAFVENLKPDMIQKNQALQLIFDVKVVGAFVRGRKGLPVGVSRTLQTVVDRISSFIDQIDYNILLPHLDQYAALHAAAVKNSYFSLICLDNIPGIVPGMDARVAVSKPSLQSSAGLSPLPISFNLLYLQPSLSGLTKM